MTSEEIMSKIKEVILKKGLSKYRIQKDAGISPSQLNRWIDGEVSPSLENLIKLCKVVDLKVKLIDSED